MGSAVSRCRSAWQKLSFGQPVQTPRGIGLLVGVGAEHAAKWADLLKPLALVMELLQLRNPASAGEVIKAWAAALHRVHTDKGGCEECSAEGVALLTELKPVLKLLEGFNWGAGLMYGAAAVLPTLVRAGPFVESAVRAASGDFQPSGAEVAYVLVALRDGSVRAELLEQCSPADDPFGVTCTGYSPSAHPPPRCWAEVVGQSKRLDASVEPTSQACSVRQPRCVAALALRCEPRVCLGLPHAA